MFAAYQAGAWKELRGRFIPDAVIGASAGALNGWAIASDIDPDELIEHWLTLNLRGMPSGTDILRIAEALEARCRPVRELGVSLTRLLPPRPRLFRNPGLTARHLLASCAVPFHIRPQRIDGRLYIDGGFLGALPLWAVHEMGASRVVALHVMSGLPWWWRAGARGLRKLAGYPESGRKDLELVMIAPERLLGGFRDAAVWDRENARRWIGQGRRDAARTIQFHSDLF